jgi:hypothetical protein
MSFRRVAPLLVALFVSSALAQDFKKQVIYQIITDRFFSGSTSNDNPSQSSGLYDGTHTNWRLYWGGDLAGIQQKISYLQSMGITAIWISPPVDNLNLNIPDGGGNPQAPYHGYAARDFKRIGDFSEAGRGAPAVADSVGSMTPCYGKLTNRNKAPAALLL